ncbi:MAG: N-acyl-D-amino acid deacylase, partial [Bacteroidota bacterium]
MYANKATARHVLFVFLLVASWGCQPTSDKQKLQDILQTIQPDLLIRDGNMLDGTGSPAVKRDILLSGDSILFIGEVGELPGVATLNLQGEIVAPGFIDAHAHGDPLRHPDFINFLSMGVTTICLGQDGFSPPYKNIRDWMEKVDRKELGLNIIPFVGHNTLRELSGIRFEENPSEEGLEEMVRLLRDALTAGCFGISTGLEYNPGLYAGKKELSMLAEAAGEFDRLMMSHIRNEDDDQLQASLEELIHL